MVYSYNYFVRVMERLNEEFEDEEEKGIFFTLSINICHVNLFLFIISEIFITNVFEQTNEKEMDLMCNQVISKVIEKLLSLAQPDILEKFAKIIQKEMVCFLHYFIQYFNVLMQYLFTLRELFVQMPMPATSWKRLCTFVLKQSAIRSILKSTNFSAKTGSVLSFGTPSTMWKISLLIFMPATS